MKSIRLTEIAKHGALLACVALSLTGCALGREPSTPTLIEVPFPVVQRIPEQRIEPLILPNRLPGQMTNGDVEARLLDAEEVIQRANADRCWIRCRQDGLNRRQCEDQCDG